MLVATFAVGPGLAAGGASIARVPTQLPPPVAGQTVNAALRAGKVRYRLPGASAFAALTEPQQLPIGTTFDTTAGRVTLTSASDAQGDTQKAWFYEGTFTVGQTQGDQPVTTLALAGAKPVCAKTASARATTKRKSRHLWGDGKGRFRTAGTFSSATVRGTRWVVIDRCDGTLTRVVRGVVAVRDFRRKTTVLVRAGHEYLARAPK
jgi:peptidoglycan hydrolase-like protein with peptidoglycan-binding domain